MSQKRQTTSIALCTYNGETFLKEQLESIIQQTKQPDEIVICDDLSKDNSVQVARSILQQWSGRWQVIVNEHNLGFRKNFQKAINLCHGDVIFLSDQDDVWDKMKIEEMMQAFTDPDVILAFHDAEVVGEELNLLYPSLWKVMDFSTKIIQDENFKIVFDHNVMQGAACCFRRELYQIAKPFPEDAYHDEWLLLVALCSGKVLPVNKALLKYRQAQNIVGGMPVVKIKKIKKWVSSLHKAIQSHYEYIVKRDILFSELVKHFNDDLPKQLFYYKQVIEFNRFLEHRILAIRHEGCYPTKSEYEHWYLKKIARKQIIKDYMLRFGL